MKGLDAGTPRMVSLFELAQWPKPFLVVWFILLLGPGWTRIASAQEISSPTTHDSTLSERIQSPQVSTPSRTNAPEETHVGTITGTVVDTNRDVLQGARVTLIGPSGAAIQTVESGSNGQFTFTGVPQDDYKITVTASGMRTFTSPQIPLHAGETRIVPAVILSVSGGATSVTVTAHKEQLAEQQVSTSSRPIHCARKASGFTQPLDRLRHSGLDVCGFAFVDGGWPAAFSATKTESTEAGTA